MSDNARDGAGRSGNRRASFADSTAVTLVVAALLAGAASYALHELRPSDFLSGLPVTDKPAKRPVRVAEAREPGINQNIVSRPATAAPAAGEVTPPEGWLAAAPGRVEPRGGETRLRNEASGRIADLHVALGDAIEAGDLIMTIDDRDVRARISALRTNEQALKRDRDEVAATGKPAQDRRRRTDDLADAERTLSDARLSLDEAVVGRRNGTSTADDVSRARAALAKAEKAVADGRVELSRALTVANLPAPNRLEAALASARSELTLAEIALDRHRLRAPLAGRIIELNAKAGEMASPTQPLPHVVIGDLDGLRLRAEVEERDLAKIRIGQRVLARSTAFPDQTFEGKVASIAPALGPPRLAARGPRKPSDVDVLEVMVDLDGKPPLKPGQRVDVFFTKDGGV
ncbi:MAG: efflux RND transporter periplasmic adaptor subunit [Hyphomicrobiaceae bacterium]